jgi:hypothetical protein
VLIAKLNDRLELRVLGQPVALAEVRRLDELHFGAPESQNEAGLQLGLHGELADELESLTADNWTRERVWCQRMLAPPGSGGVAPDHARRRTQRDRPAELSE